MEWQTSKWGSRNYRLSIDRRSVQPYWQFDALRKFKSGKYSSAKCNKVYYGQKTEGVLCYNCVIYQQHRRSLSDERESLAWLSFQ